MKDKIRNLISRTIKTIYRVNPGYARGVVKVQNIALESCDVDLTSPDICGSVDFNNEFTADAIAEVTNEDAVIARIMESYTAAKDRQKAITGAYSPAADWGKILDSEWRSVKNAIARNDSETVGDLLGNFFRNECITGYWGDNRMFEKFRDSTPESLHARATIMKRQYEKWRELFPTTPIGELDAPRIGNPWGYQVGGNLLYEPVFEYHYQANYINSLVGYLENPVVLEIGGGFGGLAYQLIKSNAKIKYIGIDLPESILLQTYYLQCAFPQAKILTYKPGLELTPALVEKNDIILMPNFCVPEIPAASCDFIINVRSFAEMPEETIVEYFAQIDRIGRLWFFHENIYKKRQDQWFGIPSTDFPKLTRYLLLAASETRWPKYGPHELYPCQENLFINSHSLALVENACRRGENA